MEIRKFKPDGIEYVVAFSRMVFDNAIRKRQADPSYNRFFDEYMNVEILRNQVARGELIVWGATQNNEILGVIALTKQGHITMLYVSPKYWGRKIGRTLLNEAKSAAAKELGLDWVTVNATPAWTGSFFLRNGFKPTDYSQNYSSLYMSMRTKCERIHEYTARRVSGKTWAITIATFICLILGTTIGYIFYFLK